MKNITSNSPILIGLSILLAFPLYAQQQKNVVNLDSILLMSVGTKTTLAKSVYALDVLGKEAINTANTEASANQFLNQIAGVTSSNNLEYTQDLRISIRGFGARSAFGTRGIKLIMDGTPLTTADGTTSSELLDPLTIGNIEVIKGSAGALYGNSSNGVIFVNSITPKKNRLYLRAMLGSYAQQNYQLRNDRVWSTGNLIASLSYRGFDGYREHNETQKISFLTRANFYLNDRQTLSLDLRYAGRPKNDSPGGVSISQIDTDRKAARDRNIELGSSEKVDEFRLSTNYVYTIDSLTRIKAKGWWSNRQLLGKIPTNADGGYIDLTRNFYGIEAELKRQIKLVNLFLDMGYQSQNDNRDRYNVEVGGEKGVQRSNQDEVYANFYTSFRAEASLSENIRLQGGLRYDHIEQDYKDLFIDNGDQSFNQPLDEINPFFGTNITLAPNHYLFANYGTSFETPTLNEVSKNAGNVGGNRNLKSQHSSNFEVGYRGQASIFIYYITGYLTKTSDEILLKEISNDVSIYQNTGSTDRFGIEGSATIFLAKGLSLRGTLNVSSLKFKTYSDPNGEKLDGNVLPGIPEQQFSLQLHYSTQNQWAFRLEGLYKGQVYADNDNEVKVSPYNIWTAKIDKSFNVGSVIINPYATVQNIFSEKYFSNIRINAFGGRFYEGAPDTNFAFGLVANF